MQRKETSKIINSLFALLAADNLIINILIYITVKNEIQNFVRLARLIISM